MTITPMNLWYVRICVVHRMLGWSVSQFCQIAWCWRSSCVCPMMPCWEPVWPADSGWLSPEMSSFGESCFTATTAYHALYPDTQVNKYNHIYDRGNLTVLRCKKRKPPLTALCIDAKSSFCFNESWSAFVQRLCHGTESSDVCLTVSPVWRFRLWENTVTKSSTWLSLTGVTGFRPALKTAQLR